MKRLDLNSARAQRTAALALLLFVILAVTALIAIPAYKLHEHYDTALESLQFRFDKLRDVDFVLGSDKRQEYDFSVISGATEEQKKLYKQYLNGDL